MREWVMRQVQSGIADVAAENDEWVEMLKLHSTTWGRLLLEGSRNNSETLC